jgi:hypothetical protein
VVRGISREYEGQVEENFEGIFGWVCRGDYARMKNEKNPLSNVY